MVDLRFGFPARYKFATAHRRKRRQILQVLRVWGERTNRHKSFVRVRLRDFIHSDWGNLPEREPMGREGRIDVPRSRASDKYGSLTGGSRASIRALLGGSERNTSPQRNLILHREIEIEVPKRGIAGPPDQSLWLSLGRWPRWNGKLFPCFGSQNQK